MSLNLVQIDNYISALIDNAESLISEATILYQSNAYARAYTLAHLSREELSKCVILYGAGRRILGGSGVDWKTTMRRLRDHKSKLRQETVKNSIVAVSMGDQETSELMMNNVDMFASYRNNQKNISIYVGLNEDGEITIPSDVITAEQAYRAISLANLFLKEEQQINETLGKLSDKKPGSLPKFTDIESLDPERLKEFIKDFAVQYREAMKQLYEDESNK